MSFDLAVNLGVQILEDDDAELNLAGDIGDYFALHAGQIPGILNIPLAKEENRFMSLKRKVIAMVFAVFLISGALDFAIQQFVVMPSFHDLEREEATKNMGRVLESINREIQVISLTTSDWGYWDDFYRYATDRNQDFLETTLNEDGMGNAKLNLISVYDAEGKMLWGSAMDLESKETLKFGDISAQQLPEDHPFLHLPEITSEVWGLFRASHPPLMLAAKHILTSKREGPPRGILVLGRLLDEAAIKRISEQVRLQLSISVISDDEPVADWIRPGVRSLPHSPVRLENGKDTLTASTIVPDIYGQPFLTVRVDTPRAITARGKSAVLLAIVSIGSAGLLVMGLLLFMLHRTILNPLAGLTAHAVQVGEKGDLLARLTLNRKDEVGVLANAFDQMIDRLSETRSKLLDQSFQSGIAEMASGVLHNIGNAMTPLGVQLVALNEELRGAPLHEMEMADRELSDPSTPADRRVDLTRFVELAGSEMAGTIGRARDHVAAVGRQVQYVHQILADQDRYSRAARVVEPVCMRDVVLRSAETLSPQMRAAMAVEVDRGVKEVGNVLSSRAALDQVVSNLLVNAAESMIEGGVQGGRLLVSAVREEVDGAPMSHFYFKDNGKGIPEEHLKRVFERRFSTKGRGSGLGLHWSANTVTALKGLLYAGMEASSGGACLHLLLPLVVEKNGQSGMEADKSHE